MALKAFLDYLKLEKNYSDHTLRAYEQDINEFKLFASESYGEQDLTQIDYHHLRAWIIQLVDKGISNRTVNRKVSSLKSYYKFLLKVGDVRQSPLNKHKSLKVSKRIQVPFSEIEVSSVIDRLKESDDFKTLRDLLIVELLYGTGMRRAELSGLLVGNVDFEQKTLRIIGKRNKERIVPLLPTVIRTIYNYLELRTSVLEFDQHSPLIVTNKGLKIYNTLVYRIINRYFSEASDKLKTSPHILRHSFATHLLNQGADLNVVKELLGHASLASTQVYTHNSIKALRDVYTASHPRSKK